MALSEWPQELECIFTPESLWEATSRADSVAFPCFRSKLTDAGHWEHLVTSGLGVWPVQQFECVMPWKLNSPSGMLMAFSSEEVLVLDEFPEWGHGGTRGFIRRGRETRVGIHFTWRCPVPGQGPRGASLQPIAAKLGCRLLPTRARRHLPSFAYYPVSGTLSQQLKTDKTENQWHLLPWLLWVSQFIQDFYKK